MLRSGFLPSRRPYHGSTALCAKYPTDRPTFLGLECGECGTDRPTFRIDHIHIHIEGSAWSVAERRGRDYSRARPTAHATSGLYTRPPPA